MDVNKNNLSLDKDIEPDGEAYVATTPLRDTINKMTAGILPLKNASEPKAKYQERHSDQIDSGILSLSSGSLELKGSNLEPSLEYVYKSPVQCSEDQEDSVDTELQARLDKLSVTEDVEDEGHSSMSLKSSDLESITSERCLQDSPDIIVDLYEQDDDGDTIVHVAVVSLLTETAKTLIDLALDVDCLNIQNFLHQSPLHLAVLTGQVEIVQALIAKGVDVTLRDQQGNTPLHIACRKGDRDAVQMIVQSFGNDVTSRTKYFSVKNCEGLTCLHVAAIQKEFIILGHLFAKGADVNMGDAKSGRTILHSAVERKDIETVSLLLTHPDIDIDCKTFKGETPVVLAYWRNYQDIVKRLKAKGAYFSYDVVEDSDDEYTA